MTDGMVDLISMFSCQVADDIGTRQTHHGKRFDSFCLKSLTGVPLLLEGHAFFKISLSLLWLHRCSTGSKKKKSSCGLAAVYAAILNWVIVIMLHQQQRSNKRARECLCRETPSAERGRGILQIVLQSNETPGWRRGGIVSGATPG